MYRLSFSHYKNRRLKRKKFWPWQILFPRLFAITSLDHSFIYNTCNFLIIHEISPRLSTRYVVTDYSRNWQKKSEIDTMKNKRCKSISNRVRIANSIRSTVYVILPWELGVTSNRVISLARDKAACKLNVFQFETVPPKTLFQTSFLCTEGNSPRTYIPRGIN